MNTPKPSHSRRFSKAGFSLVEVVLAVGIMALGVVTILGLLPHGMEISRQTANELAETRIVDTIVGDIQAMGWAELEAAKDGEGFDENLFFDDQGLKLEAGDQDLEALVSYVAHVEVPEPDVYLPTNAAAPDANRNLRRVIVKVASVPMLTFNFDNPPAAVPVKTFTQLVARTR